MAVKYRPGDIVQGTVIGIQTYGAFIQLDDGHKGLVHISEISEKYVKNIEDYLQIGDKVNFKVIEIDDKDEHVKLSLKSLNVSHRSEKRKFSPFLKQRKQLINTNKEMFDDLLIFINQEIEKEKEGFTMIKVNLENAKLNESISTYQTRVNEIHQMIHEKTGAGNDFLGWVEQPIAIFDKELLHIVEESKRIIANYDVLVVCGIGGSYLGARAGIDFVNGLYKESKVKVIYFGNTFSPTYAKQVMDYLSDKNFAVNVISKSGTTTESAIGFRLLKNLLINKYGIEESRKRIICTTDKSRGALKTAADKEGYESFVLADDIGGRYSVLTPVGLLPIGAAGIDVPAVILGAKQAYYDLLTPDLTKNPAYQYAVARYILGKEKKVEVLISYEPHLVMLAEWWKQLFGESEGKDEKGLLPDSMNFSTDLHSLGQYVQSGSKILFETCLKFTNPMYEMMVPVDEENLDGLNYLTDKPMSLINELARQGTLEAHAKVGNVPNLVIECEKNDAYTFGYLTYFFMKSCAMSAYLLDVNPFNQPGVEIYKKNMFRLLGKK